MAKSQQKAKAAKVATPGPDEAAGGVDVEVPKAKVVTKQPPRDHVLRAKIGAFVLVTLLGWAFVLASNKLHVTAPVVFVCLGWLALLFTIVNLWRTGAAAAAPAIEDEDWGRPIVARGELEKEKKTLLKGIKEAEFDAAMGKLSKADAASMINEYRARAIEVIKQIDHLSAGEALSTRDQIDREVRARLALAGYFKPEKPTAAKPAGPAPAPRPDPRLATPAAPLAEPPRMPITLAISLGILVVGAILNLAAGSIVIPVIQALLIVGVLAGNDGIRQLLRGLAVIQILWLLVNVAFALATASDHGRLSDVLGSPVFLAALVIGVGTPAYLAWTLGTSEVRDWMFRQNFNLEPRAPLVDVEAEAAREAGEAELEAAEAKTKGAEVSAAEKLAAAEAKAAAAQAAADEAKAAAARAAAEVADAKAAAEETKESKGDVA